MRFLAKRNYFKKSHTEILELKNSMNGGGGGELHRAIEHICNWAEQPEESEWVRGQEIWNNPLRVEQRKKMKKVFAIYGISPKRKI